MSHSSPWAAFIIVFQASRAACLLTSSLMASTGQTLRTVKGRLVLFCHQPRTSSRTDSLPAVLLLPWLKLHPWTLTLFFLPFFPHTDGKNDEVVVGEEICLAPFSWCWPCVYISSRNICRTYVHVFCRWHLFSLLFPLKKAGSNCWYSFTHYRKLTTGSSKNETAESSSKLVFVMVFLFNPDFSICFWKRLVKRICLFGSQIKALKVLCGLLKIAVRMFLRNLHFINYLITLLSELHV